MTAKTDRSWAAQADTELASVAMTTRDYLRTLIRWLWLPLLLTILGAAIPLLLTPEQESGDTVVAHIGLTDEVGWPFYGAVRQRVLALAEDNPIDELVPSVAANISAVDVDAPPSEAFVAVEVTAGSSADAAAAANAFIEQLVALDNANRSTFVQARIAALQLSYEELAADISVVDAELAENIASEAAAQAAWRAASDSGVGIESARAAMLDADQSIRDGRATRDQLFRAQNEVSNELAGAEAEAAGAAQEIEVLRRAQPIDEPVSSVVTSTILGALAGLAIGLVTVWVIASEWGRIGSAESLYAATGIGTVDFNAAGISTLASWVAGRSGEGAAAVVGDKGSSEPIFRGVFDRLGPTVTANPDSLDLSAETAPDQDRVRAIAALDVPEGADLFHLHDRLGSFTSTSEAETPILIDGGDIDSQWFVITRAYCAAAILVTPANTRRGDLRRKLARVHDAGLVPSWVVLTPKHAS